MFGISLEGQANVFRENEGVYINNSYGASIIKKNHNSIVYHKTTEYAASRIMFIFKEDGENNIANILTKALGNVKRFFIRSRIMYDEKVKILK